MKNIHCRSILSIALILISIMILAGCSAAPEIPEPDSYKSYIKPSTPKNISATQGAPTEDGVTGIKVTWDNEGDADYYNLYIANAADGDFSSPIKLPANAASYIDNAADGLVKLYYLEAVKSFSLDNGTQTLTSSPSETAVGSSTPSIEFYVRSGVKSNTVNWVVRGIDYEGEKLFPNVDYILIRNGSEVEVPETTASEYSFVDNDVSPDTAYTYQLRMTYGESSSDGRYILSSELSVETGLNYIPDSAENISVSDNTYSIVDGKLITDSIDLSWVTKVHSSILFDPTIEIGDDSNSESTNAHPYFLIERRVHGSTGSWQTALTYDGNPQAVSDGLLTKSIDQHDGYYYFTFSFKDTGLAAGTEYEYRITTRFYFSKTWYTEQESESAPAPDTGSTLAAPYNFTIANYSINGETDKDVTATLSWNYGSVVLPSEFKFVIEKRDILDSASTWTALDSIEINKTSSNGYSAVDSFHLSAEELEMSKNYSYRIYLQTNDNSITAHSYLTVPTPLLVNGIRNVFDVIDTSSFTVSNNLADRVRVSWTTDLTAGVSADISSLDPNRIVYTLWTSEGNSISGDQINVSVPGADNKLQVSYEDTDYVSGRSYYLVAQYLNEDSTILSETTTSMQAGALLSPASIESSELGQTDGNIKITFTGDDRAAEYRLYYRNKGSVAWTAFGTSIANSSEVEKIFEFTEGASASLAEKGNRIEFVVVNVDTEGNESAKDESLITEGSYFGLADFNVTASSSVTDNRPNIDSITVSWNIPDGADSIIVWRSETADGSYVTLNNFGSDTTSTIDRFTSSDKLIGTYYYKVQPYAGDVAPDLHELEPIPGSFFAPPQNITASKGTHYNGIEISWDPVENASGYRIYRRVAGSGNDWEYIFSTVSGVTTAVNSGLTADMDYEYTVASKYDEANYSMLQNELDNKTADQNVGYPLLDVDINSVKISYDGNGKLTVSFDPVRGATHYEFKESSFITDVIDNSDSISKTYTIWGNSKIMIGDFTIRAYNDVVSASALNINSAYKGSERIISLTDLVKEINAALAVHITAADKQFGGEWWPPTSGLRDSVNIYGAENDPIYIRSNYGGWSYPSIDSSPGFIRLNNYIVSDSDVSLKTLSDIIVGLDYGFDDMAGYLGRDPLQSIGRTINNNPSGNIDIIINPDISEHSLYLRYRDVRVDTIGGSYEILFDGNILTTITDSADFPRMLGN